MRTLVFAVLILQIFASILTNSIKDTTSATELYNKVYEAFYDEAVNQTKTLQNEGESRVIYETVYKLLDNNVNNIIHYAYKLWIAGEKGIVKENFPRAFKLIFNEDDIRIWNRKYKLQLILHENIEENKDRAALGQATDVETRRYLWRFEPVWEHNRVYFKIKNLERNMFLKCSNNVKTIDRVVLGDASNVANNRLTWALETVLNYKELAFRIVNQEIGQPIKLEATTESNNNMNAVGHGGSFGNDGKQFEWIIEDKDMNPDLNTLLNVVESNQGSSLDKQLSHFCINYCNSQY